MSATNVPKLQIVSTGVILPQESETLAGVLADYNAAFGGDLNTTNLETPQGQLASSTAAIISDKNNQIAELVNDFDPDVSKGIVQDAIGKFYFMDRLPALPTVVICDCFGKVGTVLPIGTKAKSTSGKVYISTHVATIVLDSVTNTGKVSVQFECEDTGVIDCPANSVNKILQSVVGWESVNNPTAGVVGNDVESPVDFEMRRKNSVAVNSHGSLSSVYSAIFDVTGVSDVFVVENCSSAIKIIGGVSLLPHSLYAAVSGGNSTDVAQAIFSKKGGGCDTNGNTVVVIYDENYAQPQPQYPIKFQIPTPVVIKFTVNIVAKTGLNETVRQMIKQSVLAAFNGQDGGSRVRIGSTMLASRYYASILAVSPLISIINVGVGANGDQDIYSVGIDKIPTLDVDNITVNYA